MSSSYSGGSSESASGSNSSDSGDYSKGSEEDSGFDAYEKNSDEGIPAYHDSDDGKEGATMNPSDNCVVQCKCLYINERFQIPCTGNTTVKELRRKLGKQANHPDDAMRMYHFGYNLDDKLDMTLSEASFGQGEPRLYYIYLDSEETISAFNGDTPDLAAMKRQFDTSGLISERDASDIVRSAKKIFRDEPNMVEIDDPVTVIGDIHGQWYDMAGIMGAAGHLGQRNHVFLGDYVDRGYFSCEVILYLLAAKILHPQKVTLLRGNHETDVICRKYGFQEEAKFKYGRKFTKDVVDCFRYMPFCAMVHSAGKQIICMHGGLSPQVRNLKDIERIDRFKEPHRDTPLKDFIWADPTKDFAVKYDIREWDLNTLKEHPKNASGDYESGFVEGGRGGGTDYGYNSTMMFLADNDVLSVFRGHEQQPDGLQQFKDGPKWKFPAVNTVFSAPNYTDESKNRGSVAHITGGILKFKHYPWAIHPQHFKYKKPRHGHSPEHGTRAFERNLDSEDVIQFINHFQHDLLREVPFPELKGEYIAMFRQIHGEREGKHDVRYALKQGGDFADVPGMPDHELNADELAELNRLAAKLKDKYKGYDYFGKAVDKEAVYEQDPHGTTFDNALATIKQRQDIVGNVARNLNIAGAKALYGRASRLVCNN